MSLAAPEKENSILFFLTAVSISVVIHAGVPFLVLPTKPAHTPPENHELGVQGAIMFDLSDLIAAPQEIALDSVFAEEQVDAPTVTESPEYIEVTKTVDAPILNQTPYEVAENDLKFRIANPIETQEEEISPDEIASEFIEEMVDKPSSLGAKAQDASVNSVSGIDAIASAETAQASSEGISDEQTAEISEWQQNLVIAIAKAKGYPSLARKKRIEGTVKIKFSLNEFGAIISKSVLESSGHNILDQYAIEIFTKIGKFPTPPSHTAANQLTMIVPINFAIKEKNRVK